MLFGNWNVTPSAIKWEGNGSNKFLIPTENLNKTSGRINSIVVYDWILEATAEEWLAQDDLYDLNFAFVYAMAKTGLDFDYDIFDATLAEQYDQFDEEEDDDEDVKS